MLSWAGLIEFGAREIADDRRPRNREGKQQGSTKKKGGGKVSKDAFEDPEISRDR